jgi:putative hemolysin
MSPAMLTLVAAVLAYDFALESCERTSSRSLVRYAISDTSDEKDMVASWSVECRSKGGLYSRAQREEFGEAMVVVVPE